MGQLIESKTFILNEEKSNVCVSVYIHGLSFSERWVLGTDVVLYAGSRFESHWTAGAFVKHVTMSLLDVRLH